VPSLDAEEGMSISMVTHKSGTSPMIDISYADPTTGRKKRFRKVYSRLTKREAEKLEKQLYVEFTTKPASATEVANQTNLGDFADHREELRQPSLLSLDAEEGMSVYMVTRKSGTFPMIDISYVDPTTGRSERFRKVYSRLTKREAEKLEKQLYVEFTTKPASATEEANQTNLGDFANHRGELRQPSCSPSPRRKA
jgi:hypothetical protein